MLRNDDTKRECIKRDAQPEKGRRLTTLRVSNEAENPEVKPENKLDLKMEKLILTPE